MEEKLGCWPPLLGCTRMARWDLLKVIQTLSTRLTKWSEDCDKALHRLVCYVDFTRDWVLKGFVGDGTSALDLRLYSDADFAGDRPGYRSTSGVFLGLAGPNTSFPLSAKAARQTSVSHSTVEAEIVAANTGVRTIGLPALDLWEVLLGRLVSMTLMEDNETTFQIIKAGKNPTMRHISRTHGVNAQWLHDAYTKRLFKMQVTKTDEQVADISTKHMPEKTIGKRLCKILAPGPPEVR